MILIIAFICALALMYIQRIIYKKYWNDRLDVKISYKSVDCVAGEENELIEVITNNKWLPFRFDSLFSPTGRCFSAACVGLSVFT